MNEQAHSQTDGERHSVDAGLARPGAITYLHLPGPDVRRVAAFYRDVFGWDVDGLDSDRPSFTDAGGQLGGAWLGTGLAVTEPGPLLYVYVDDVAATVGQILARGGAMVTEPYPEGKLTVARFRDPAGNVIGLWHDTTRTPDTGAARPSAVTAVPEHLHTVTARLALTDAVAAIDLYVRAFDAQEVGERHCMPDGTLVHAELRIGDSIVMVTEDEGYTALLATYWPDVDAAWERAVAAGMEILHPLADQFYGERGGRLRDPYGQEWMLSARLEQLTAAEIAARAASQG